MAQDLTIIKVLEKDVAMKVLELVKQIEEPRWVTRTSFKAPRGIDGATCNYDFCGQRQMTKELQEELKKLAPVYVDFPLAEVAVNRYKENDYLGKHKDRDFYRRNLVVSLQEKGDGLYINDEDTFIEDVTGQGVLIEGVGPTHSVPPVKNERYTLIYLYE